MPRVVFDTNVVLSALLFPGGRMAELRSLWRRGHAVPLACRETTRELLRVLTYPKFRLAEADREALLGDYLPFCEVIALPEKLPEVPPCRDKQDLVFLHLAYVAKADCLVSGDADLLALAGESAVPVLAVPAFFEWLG